ncbi:hypothetical protein AMEX_G8521 [Astyanax mexicanus]|uniref:Uncharacterized protein n=1 Tax=Astyanax mexicanus TaxID=7994 RepID=A0A8T2LWY6_ASTMX|nr:hypothetical protein AMEX_G8521 [Astyanax mexicanus]
MQYGSRNTQLRRVRIVHTCLNRAILHLKGEQKRSPCPAMPCSPLQSRLMVKHTGFRLITPAFRSCRNVSTLPCSTVTLHKHTGTRTHWYAVHLERCHVYTD